MFDESPNFILIFGTGFLFHFLLYRFLESSRFYHLGIMTASNLNCHIKNPL